MISPEPIFSVQFSVFRFQDSEVLGSGFGVKIRCTPVHFELGTFYRFQVSGFRCQVLSVGNKDPALKASP